MLLFCIRSNESTPNQNLIRVGNEFSKFINKVMNFAASESKFRDYRIWWGNKSMNLMFSHRISCVRVDWKSCGNDEINKTAFVSKNLRTYCFTLCHCRGNLCTKFVLVLKCSEYWMLCFCVIWPSYAIEICYGKCEHRATKLDNKISGIVEKMTTSTTHISVGNDYVLFIGTCGLGLPLLWLRH